MIIEFFGPFVFYFRLVVLTVHYLNKHSITLQHRSHFILSETNNFMVGPSYGLEEVEVLIQDLPLFFFVSAGKEEYVATFKGSEFFCYDLSLNPIQSSSDEITLSFKTLQRNGLMLHTGKSADYVNLALKNGAVSLVINLGSGAFEALVEPVNGKFNDNDWHDVKVTRNLRQVTALRVMRELWN